MVIAMNYTNEQLDALFENFPDELQDFIMDPQTHESVGNIAAAHSIVNEEEFRKYVFLVLLGIWSITEFEQALQSMRLSDEETEQIIIELDGEVLSVASLIKENLESIENSPNQNLNYAKSDQNLPYHTKPFLPSLTKKSDQPEIHLAERPEELPGKVIPPPTNLPTGPNIQFKENYLGHIEDKPFMPTPHKRPEPFIQTTRPERREPVENNQEEDKPVESTSAEKNPFGGAQPPSPEQLMRLGNYVVGESGMRPIMPKNQPPQPAQPAPQATKPFIQTTRPNIGQPKPPQPPPAQPPQEKPAPQNIFDAKLQTPTNMPKEEIKVNDPYREPIA